MDLHLEVISKAELSELQHEALKVPFLYDGHPLMLKMARGKVLSATPAENAVNTPLSPKTLILALCATPFQESVYRALMTVPRGSTITYGALAALAGHPRAVRAAATTVASNPFALLIPCHRVIPATGGSGNYRWGKTLKQQLLESETTAK